MVTYGHKIELLVGALQKIANLDYTVDSTDVNEWAEAECFHKAQNIANEALEEFKIMELITIMDIIDFINREILISTYRLPSGRRKKLFFNPYTNDYTIYHENELIYTTDNIGTASSVFNNLNKK
jgi:hypothetical protein